MAATDAGMDNSANRKRYAHLDNLEMDNSYSNMRVEGALDDMIPKDSTLPEYPVSALDTAVAAHCGRERLESGSNWCEHGSFRGVDVSHVVKPSGAETGRGGGAVVRHRFYAKYTKGVIEPLHMHQAAGLEWVVLSGKFYVEAGPIVDVPGHERLRETLVAGSFFAVPKGQPHYVKCLEGGVVLVSYDGLPDMTMFAGKNFEN